MSSSIRKLFCFPLSIIVLWNSVEMARILKEFQISKHLFEYQITMKIRSLWMWLWVCVCWYGCGCECSLALDILKGVSDTPSFCFRITSMAFKCKRYSRGMYNMYIYGDKYGMYYMMSFQKKFPSCLSMCPVSKPCQVNKDFVSNVARREQWL